MNDESIDEMPGEISVLRLSHRIGRDDRVTTHVGLTARALGASSMYIDGANTGAVDAVEEVVNRFGGSFSCSLVSDPRGFIDDWRGSSVHLTMYGLPVEDVIDDIHRPDEDVLVVVGSEKVPGYIYDIVDFNVGVTNQPHSEISALAVFLHMYFEGEELSSEFPGGNVEVVPSESGKKTRYK